LPRGFQRRLPALCRQCHEDIDADILQQRGFHGRLLATADDCRSCHGEHLGRDADIVKLNKDAFDHGKTDFVLEGAHREAVCTSCHQLGKLSDPAGKSAPEKYRDAPSTCLGCHQDDDCHDSRRWSNTKFDHGKTDFPLKGKHQDASCGSCHPDEKYADIPDDCVACHQSADVHKGFNGRECETCHSEAGWKKVTFDHGKDTKFKLTGGHRDLVCTACHKDDTFNDKPSTRCDGCHGADDIHQGQNGDQCQDCHDTAQWNKTSFDHDKDTDFPLAGKHADAQCDTCHQGGRDQSLGNQCVDCHRADDAHGKGMGEDCGQCHNPKSWGENIRFNHDFTAFPLVGMHALAGCETCHGDHQYSETDSDCAACHEGDDAHKGAMGRDCAQCHNPNGWQQWLFDHNSQTDFDLDGAHQDLACASCHGGSTKAELETGCHSCHQQDDPHRKRFGRDCERCHTTDSFRDIRVQSP
jgi:hypothetical protein